MMKLGFDPCAFPGACCPDCSSCRQPVGVFQCQGCCKIFCTNDSNRHRQELQSELREIIHESEQYNAFWKEELVKRQRVLKGKQDNAMECIEDWEAKAIAKIKQASAEAREQVCKLFEHHRDIYPECTSLDATALRQAMDTDGFLEPDLEKWRKNLQCWKTRESSFETDFIRFRECEPFIPKLIVEGEYTRCPPRPPCVQPEPCVWRNPCCPQNPPAYRDPCAGPKYSARPSHSSVIMIPINDGYDPCTQRDLRSDVRRFRYKIKCVCADCSSKSSYTTRGPCESTSQFGQRQSDQGYINALPSGARAGCQSGLELGDTYALVVDCDRRNVCLTNERTNKSYALDIDPFRGPLPKQLHVRFLDD